MLFCLEQVLSALVLCPGGLSLYCAYLRIDMSVLLKKRALVLLLSIVIVSMFVGFSALLPESGDKVTTFILTPQIFNAVLTKFRTSATLLRLLPESECKGTTFFLTVQEN